MYKINLTKENKEIIREYYTSLYIILLKDMGIYEESMYKQVYDNVSYMIYTYLKKGNIKVAFSEYITRNIPIKKIYDIKLTHLSEKINLIRQGNLKYLETLIELYKIRFKLKISLTDLENKIEDKDKILDDGLLLIEETIKKYFLEELNYDFSVYVSSRINSFYFKNKIKTGFIEKNIVIDNKKGNDEERIKLYDKYYNFACKRIKNTTNLPEAKFNLLLRSLVNRNIDKYFDGKEKLSTLRNYFERIFGRLNGESEQIIVKYNLLFNDFYEESISFIEKSINEYISTYIKENNINKISLVYRLKTKSNELARRYLDFCIDNKCYKPFKHWISKNIKQLLKEKKKVSCFDLDLAINGEAEDKKEQLEILREELSYLKERVKSKYIYYIDKDCVDLKIDTYYNNIINSYVNNIIVKQNFKRRPTSSYISTRLNEKAKDFSDYTKCKFEKEKIDQMLCEQYRKMVVDYVRKKHLTNDERRIFFEYMNAVFGNYIEKGSYSIDIRLYLKEFIDSYDYNFAKNIIAIKDAEELGIKVLRHPVIK